MYKIFSFILALLLTSSAFAYELVSPSDMIQPSTTDESYAITLLSNVIAYAIGIASVLGVIGITWGGIQMMLSAGDDEKMKKARHILIYSLIGVLVAGMAFGVVQILSNVRIG
ncbi:MAG: hypothetical protein PHY14_04675 [Candidatus Gracilibacteria bacterium]|nr:hypothetical protein [Candidatus Gracilibacteria bacterium]